ncbi:CAP domain-containing protein [Deinococcus lacus]|uniref:CAP domain-containing protein n=1 Tax=Deinococcus lacus TaxID=392561 RepID=A0ABW1YE96_9DEIO
MNRTPSSSSLLAVSTLVLAAGLSSCGGSTGGTGTALPNPPAQPFIPAVGAAAGSGASHPLTRVMVPPSAEAVELLNLTNEVRTKGTLAGQPALSGTCAEGTFRAGQLAPLSYSGVLSHAAFKHATYMANVGFQAHQEIPGQPVTGEGTEDVETNRASQYFYGEYNPDRIRRSLQEAGLEATYGFVADNAAENVAGGTPGTSTTGYSSAREMLQAWLRSPGHCKNLMSSRWHFMGTAYVMNPAPQPDASPRLHQNSWVQVFSEGIQKTNVVIVPQQ